MTRVQQVARSWRGGGQSAMIPIINVGYASTNYYVLGSSTTRLLIDVGWPGTLPRLMANLRRTGIEKGFTKSSEISCFIAFYDTFFGRA